MAEQPLIIVALLGTICRCGSHICAPHILSIAFFNFAGISVTKELSATTRMVLDSVRTLIIWAFSLALGWQQFVYLQVTRLAPGRHQHSLQIIGFILLILGMFVYNDLIIGPFVRRTLVPRVARSRFGESISFTMIIKNLL
jgi:hypothetical protein